MGTGLTEQYLAYVGANVRRWRIRRGLTQLELAELVEMDLRFLQRIEAGAVNLRFRSFIRVAERLSVEPRALLRKVKIHDKKHGRPKKARSLRTVSARR